MEGQSTTSFLKLIIPTVCCSIARIIKLDRWSSSIEFYISSNFKQILRSTCAYSHIAQIINNKTRSRRRPHHKRSFTCLRLNRETSEGSRTCKTSFGSKVVCAREGIGVCKQCRGCTRARRKTCSRY